MLNAVIPADEAFVPPFATGNTPVTPVVSGKPVALVNTPDAGVPSAGVTKVGDVNVAEVASTTLPLPVLVVVQAIAVLPVAVQKLLVVSVPNVVVLEAPMLTQLVPLQ